MKFSVRELRNVCSKKKWVCEKGHLCSEADVGGYLWFLKQGGCGLLVGLENPVKCNSRLVPLETFLKATRFCELVEALDDARNLLDSLEQVSIDTIPFYKEIEIWLERFEDE